MDSYTFLFSLVATERHLSGCGCRNAEDTERGQPSRMPLRRCVLRSIENACTLLLFMRCTLTVGGSRPTGQVLVSAKFLIGSNFRQDCGVVPERLKCWWECRLRWCLSCQMTPPLPRTEWPLGHVEVGCPRPEDPSSPFGPLDLYSMQLASKGLKYRGRHRTETEGHRRPHLAECPARLGPLGKLFVSFAFAYALLLWF